MTRLAVNPAQGYLTRLVQQGMRDIEVWDPVDVKQPGGGTNRSYPAMTSLTKGQILREFRIGRDAENPSGGALIQEQRFDFGLKLDAQVTTSSRLRVNGDFYEVNSVETVDDLRPYLPVRATKRK